ncbi:MAG TPA: AAA family ATPase [Kineosporiaceae bacterium]|nr:AAA family ATPase [Kineosporiaceae bacterium]
MGRAGAARSALFGRERELAVLGRAIDGAAAGRLQVVTIGGPAGIGKSRLAAEALARASAAGFETLTATAGPLERDLSYAPVVQALRPLLDSSPARRRMLTDGLSDLGRLFDGLDLPAPPALGDAGLERTRLFEAVRRMLERAAQRAPLALLLDDVQWADPASQALLGYLARGLAGCRLLLLLTYRSGEDADASGGADDLLAALHRGGATTGDVTDVVLAGLDAAETLGLAADVLGDDPPAPLADLLAERAGGVPLFVQALVDMLVDDGELRRSGGRWVLAPTGTPAVPRLVGTLVRRRLDALPPTARAVFDLISLGGGATSHRVVRIAAPDEASALEAVARLRTAGLVSEHVVDATVVYRPVHPMHAEVAYAALPVARRQALHAAVADALEAQPGTDLRMLAHHLRGAGPAVEPRRSYPVLVRATDAALERQAGDEATACARAALDLLEHADDDLAADVGDVADARAGLGERLALGAQMAGRLDQAVTALHEAAEQRTDPHDRARDLAQASMLWWDLGGFDEARRALDAAKQLLTPLPPSPSHTHVIELELLQSGRRGDRSRRDEAMAEMERLAEATGSTRARGVVEYARVAHDIDDGKLAPALARLPHLQELARAEADPLFVERAMRPTAQALVCCGDLDGATAAAEEGIRLAGAIGVPTLSCLHLTYLSYIESYRGRYERSLELADQTVEIAERSQMSRGVAFGLSARMIALVRQERTAEAAEVLDAVERRFGAWEDADRHVFGVVDVARSLLALQQGRPAEAVRLSAAAVERVMALQVFALDAFGLALVADGRPVQAREIAARIVALWPDGDLCSALADRLLARVARAEGDDATAAALGVRAAAGFERVGLRPDAVLARLEVAELRAQDQPGEDLVGEVEELLAFLEGCGLRTSADRCRRLLRSLGRRPASGARERGPGELSRRELEVVRLVAEGRSNAEIATTLFISQRTVTTHLQNVYARLGLGSRTALARWVVETQPVTSAPRSDT